MNTTRVIIIIKQRVIIIIIILSNKRFRYQNVQPPESLLDEV